MTDAVMTTGCPEELAQRCGMAAGVSLDPQGGPALDADDGETLTGSFQNVSLVLGDSDQGPGILFVTNRYSFPPDSAVHLFARVVYDCTRSRALYNLCFGMYPTCGVPLW